jgi:putative aldouronate transport system permease protein
MLKSKSFYFRQTIVNTVLIVVTLIMVLPLVLLFMASITSESELLVNGYSYFPKEFSIQAYKYIFQNRETIFRAYGITIFTTVIGTVVNMLLSLGLAFGLSNRKLPLRNIITFFILFTMLFSGGLVPQYIMWTNTFSIKNTILAYLLPNLLLSPMNILLIRTYMQTNVPEALYEAAKIDGASTMQVFRNVAVPLSKPIIVTMGLFSALAYWNDWTNGLYYVNKSGMLSIQTLLNRMIQDIQAIQSHAVASGTGAIMQIPAVSIRMAIAFVALIPILIIYPFLQKYFQEGITLGAVKG